MPANRTISFITVALLLIASRGATAAIPRTAAQREIQRLGSSEVLKGSVWGAFAVTAAGDTIVDINGGTRMLPASNVKLITTGAALRRLGKDFRFRTSLAYAGEVVDSTLAGDLYIVGGGDPSLCDRYKVTGDSLGTFDRWVSIIRDAGIASIEGRVIGDGRYFNGDDFFDDWSVEDDCLEYSTGAAGLNIADNMSASVRESPLYCASQFTSHLRGRGIPVTGEASSDTSVPSDSLAVIGYTESARLSDLILVANHESENLYAEALFRQLGKELYGTADYDTSALALSAVLRSMGLGQALKTVKVVDGSGLSRKNYLSPQFIAGFLRTMSSGKDSRIYMLSLPRPGRGTLKNRLSGCPESVRSRICMKSGTMDGVRCFSGYILPSDGDSGKMIAFSIMANNFISGGPALARLMDAMIVSLAAEN